MAKNDVAFGWEVWEVIENRLAWFWVLLRGLYCILDWRGLLTEPRESRDFIFTLSSFYSFPSAIPSFFLFRAFPPSLIPSFLLRSIFGAPILCQTLPIAPDLQKPTVLILPRKTCRWPMTVEMWRDFTSCSLRGGGYSPAWSISKACAMSCLYFENLTGFAWHLSYRVFVHSFLKKWVKHRLGNYSQFTDLLNICLWVLPEWV